MVQWLGLSAFTAEGPVQSLVRELRFHRPQGAALKKKKKERKKERKERTYCIAQGTLLNPSVMTYMGKASKKDWIYVYV